jgi:uncharacterized membrane protein
VLATIEFQSPVTPAILGWLALAGLVGYAIVRWLAGPPTTAARNRGLTVVRFLVVGLLLALLLNPVRVDESPGTIERPDVFYLLDTSQSMAMGDPETRWEEVVRMIRQTDGRSVEQAPARVSLFRFGHRLAAVESADRLDPGRLDGYSDASPSGKEKKKVGPTATDTQLASALRQMSTRFGRSPPAGIVLFSDGRARDAQAAEEIAGYFARLNVPIHVAPVGDMERGGDVAIVGVVAPPRVRKHSHVEVQVFLRSFGYDGRRTEVQLSTVEADGRPGRTLTALPLTLRSGIQTVSLGFQSDLQTRRLRVSIPPLPDEISLENNSFHTEVAVDRTKIRVLYLEGSPQPLTQVRRNEQYELRGPFTDLQEALSEDPDVECVVVAAPYGSARLRRVGQAGFAASDRGFPETIAELSAFDFLILSDIARDQLTDEQLQWIEHWVSRRGAGLCMAGGRSSFAAGGWGGTAMERILPVELSDRQSDWTTVSDISVQPTPGTAGHPIWHIVSDQSQNRSILRTLPSFSGANVLPRVKPNLTTVLATTDAFAAPDATASVGSGTVGTASEDLPAIVAGLYGKGRSLAVAPAITAPWAGEFVARWGQADNRHYAKFWRNAVYWLSENSSIGRRRLVAAGDKRFYRPGETVGLSASAFDEAANQTAGYRIVAMIEPQSALADLESDYAPIRWPDGLQRTSGEDGPYIAWGEEFELPRQAAGSGGYGIDLAIADAAVASAPTQSLRIELTAYEDYTQVDSTSLDIQVLHDPFEQQNPFPDHDLLHRIAEVSGGQVLSGADDLTALIAGLPVQIGSPTLKQVPVWSRWWLLSLIIFLLTAEWLWRRSIGLA